MTNRTRVALLVAAAVVVVVGFALARGSGSEDEGGTRADDPPATTAPARTAPAGTTTAEAPAPPARPRVPTIVVRDAQPVGGVRELSFRKGETIRFRVRADTAQEVHVHGYDVERAVAAGGATTFRIPADIEGRFEVELHDVPDGQIAELEVTP